MASVSPRALGLGLGPMVDLVKSQVERLQKLGIWNHALAAAWATDIVEHALPTVFGTIEQCPGFPLTINRCRTRDVPPAALSQMRAWLAGQDECGRLEAFLKFDSLDRAVGQEVVTEMRISGGTSLLHERLVACRNVTQAMRHLGRVKPGHRRSSTESPAIHAANLTASAVGIFQRSNVCERLDEGLGQRIVAYEQLPARLEEVQWQAERLRDMAGESDEWLVAADAIRSAHRKPDLWGWRASKGKYMLCLGRISESDSLLVWRARHRAH